MSASIKSNQKRQPSRAGRAPEKSIQEQLPELRPGQSTALLQELHILTREGKLNQDTRRKLKQVNHLLQFIEPLLQEALAARGDVSLVDHGAGKSYLGFIIYDLFFKARGQGTIYGIETRSELVESSKALAQKLGIPAEQVMFTDFREILTKTDPRAATPTAARSVVAGDVISVVSSGADTAAHPYSVVVVITPA